MHLARIVGRKYFTNMTVGEKLFTKQPKKRQEMKKLLFHYLRLKVMHVSLMAIDASPTSIHPRKFEWQKTDVDEFLDRNPSSFSVFR